MSNKSNINALTAHTNSISVDTVADFKALRGVPVGFKVIIGERGDSTWVAGASGAFGVPDEFSVIAGDGVDLQLDEAVDLTSEYFGSSASNTVVENTNKVQAAVDFLAPDGGVVKIPRGHSFNLKSINLNNDFQILFFSDDDSSSVSPTGAVTNELILFSANSNNGGADVNEVHLSAPLHPGIVLDAREDIPNPGTGTQSGLSSIVHRKESVNQWQSGVQSNGEWALSNWEYRCVIDLGTDDFTINPVVGDSVSGNTSGAMGEIIALSATEMTVSWESGVFEVGETITAGGNTSTSPIGTVSCSYTTKINRVVAAKNGIGAGANLPAGNAIHQWSVGGVIGVEDASGGVYGATKAGFRLFDNLASPTLGFRWALNTGTSELEIYSHSGGKVFQITTGGISQNATVRASSSVQSPKYFLGSVPASGSTPNLSSGTGTPEGVVAAPVGSMYTRTDGGAGTTLYVKESGAGNTGWVAK